MSNRDLRARYHAAFKGNPTLCPLIEDPAKALEEAEGEKAEAVKMLNLYEAPTNDEGEGGGPLSIAGRIEAMVYRDAVRARIAAAHGESAG